MQKIEELRINSIDNDEIENIINKRQDWVLQAIEDEDVETLVAISAIDKENKLWLKQQQQNIEEELHKLSKINQYITP